MITTIGRAFAVWLAGLYLAVSVAPADAQSLTWFIRSEHPNVVSVKFYSQSRRNYVWPNADEVYVLDDYETKRFSLACRPGEKICYGAWVRNRTRSFWGVGPNNRNSCRGCCYICNGGETKVIVLNP